MHGITGSGLPRMRDNALTLARSGEEKPRRAEISTRNQFVNSLAPPPLSLSLSLSFSRSFSVALLIRRQLTRLTAPDDPTPVL